MDLKKCEKGHFYDGDKYSSCPHCGGQIQQKTVDTRQTDNRRDNSIKKETDENTTRSFYSYVNTQQKANDHYEKVQDELAETTLVQSIKQKNVKNMGPVYGWIVGIAGNEYGNSYAIYAADNTIGSGIENNIVIENDTYLCKRNHTVISYNKNSGGFYYNSSESQGKLKVNSINISSDMEFNYMDTFEIGESTFMFVPLCKDGFVWMAGETSKYNTTYIGGYQTNSVNGNLNQYTNNEYIMQNSTNDKASDILNIEEAFNENYYVENDEDANLTSVLISSPWRCESCNALNSMMMSKCRICGNKK